MDRVGRYKTVIFISILFLFFSSLLWAESAGRAVKEGNKSFKKGQFDEAIKNYEEALQKNPESDIGNFNAGGALYKQERYKESVEHTQKALLSENKETQQKAQYNLGNIFYKWGISEENKDVSAAIKKVEQSLSHYEKALSMRKDDEDAKVNYEFVKKELERLKKKQNQAKQNQQKPSSEQNKEKNQEESSSQNKEKSSSGDKSKEDKKFTEQEKKGQAESSEQEENKSESAQEQDASEKKSTEGDAKQQQEGYNKNSESSASNAEMKELTAQEAQTLLKDYEATEEPKGLFRAFRSRGDLKDVEKDW